MDAGSSPPAAAAAASSPAAAAEEESSGSSSSSIAKNGAAAMMDPASAAAAATSTTNTTAAAATATATTRRPAPFRAPCPLLQALEVSFEDPQHHSSSNQTTAATAKTVSVRDCLHRRAKKIPCAAVAALLDSSNGNGGNGGSSGNKNSAMIPVNRDQLHLSFTWLLTRYLRPLRDAFSRDSNQNKDDPQQPQSTSTSLFHMERLAVAVRFAQLLLEYREAVEPPDDDPRDGTAIVPPAVEYAVLSLRGGDGGDDGDIQKWVLDLLRGIAGTLCCILEQQPQPQQQPPVETGNGATHHNHEDNTVDKNSYTSDCRTRLCRYQVAAFGLGELLQRLHPYVHTRPFVFAPFWRAASDVAAAWLAANTSNNDSSSTNSSGSAARGLPRPTVRAAAAALVELLEAGLQAAEDGEAPLPATTVRILGVVAARLTFFWKLPVAPPPPADPDAAHDESESSSDSDSNKHVARAVHVLLRLRVRVDREIPNSSSSSNANNKHLQSLAQKVDRCWAAWNSNSDNDDNDNNNKIQALSELLADKTAEHCRAPIVVWLLQHLDEQLKNGDDDDVGDDSVDLDSILRIVEDLLFRWLPRAIVALDANSNSDAAMALLERSWPTLANTFWRIEWHMAAERGRWHRLLVHWLSSSTTTAQTETTTAAHPLTRELLLDLLHRHAAALLLVPQQQQQHTTTTHKNGAAASALSNAAEPLLLLAVQLLFDGRTATPLRRNLAALLSQHWLVDPRLAGVVQDMVGTEYTAVVDRTIVAVENNDTAGKAGKRKRKKKQPQQQKRCCYESVDMIVIIQFLSQVPSLPPTGARTTTVEDSLLQLQSQNNLSGKLPTANVHAVALRIAGVTAAAGSTVTTNRSQYSTLLRHFLRVWNHHRDRTQLAVVAVAVLRYSHQIILGSNSDSNQEGDVVAAASVVSDQELADTVQVLTVCIAEAVTHRQDMSSNSASIHMAIVLEVIRVLGVMDLAVMPQTSPGPLQALARCFQSLLSAKEWIVQAHTLTALQEFATRVPSAHQAVLKQCFPRGNREIERWFKARIKGTVYVPGSAGNKSDNNNRLLQNLQRERRLALLRRLPPRRDASDKVMAARSSVGVPKGSFVMTMPTQDGRHALVVFPPGEQSMADIRHMLGRDDDDDDDSEGAEPLPDIRILQNGWTMKLDSV